MNPISFENQVVVITGAGNGLGKSYALEIASRGGAIVVNDLGGAVDGTGS
jgi:NAD(P)-dependent dehydrogenase (short-subunit alcohol dehydrogenase family)